jgi:hypothetical protein
LGYRGDGSAVAVTIIRQPRVSADEIGSSITACARFIDAVCDQHLRFRAIRCRETTQEPAADNHTQREDDNRLEWREME